jgi:hypothetical protein
VVAENEKRKNLVVVPHYDAKAARKYLAALRTALRVLDAVKAASPVFLDPKIDDRVSRAMVAAVGAHKSASMQFDVLSRQLELPHMKPKRSRRKSRSGV